MDKLKFRRSGIQARVLALTMFFTLGASLVIAASNMHQMTAEWERTTILNAEYALQTAASAIRRDVDEIDDLAGWCAYNPGMRTYLLTGDTASNQALSMYPTLTAKFNSMRTMAYIQRFLLINASGRQMMFGTAATNAVTLTPDILQRIPGYDSPNTGWDCILRDPLAQHDPRHPHPDPARHRPHSPCLYLCLPFPDPFPAAQLHPGRRRTAVLGNGRKPLHDQRQPAVRAERLHRRL